MAGIDASGNEDTAMQHVAVGGDLMETYSWKGDRGRTVSSNR